MNSKLPSVFACFLPYHDSHWENVGKKIGWKILPKDGKRMRPVQIFGMCDTRITVPSKVQFIWIAHAWSKVYCTGANVIKRLL